MHFCVRVAWIVFFSTATTWVLCVSKEEPPTPSGCNDASRACTLGLKCKKGLTFEHLVPGLTGKPGPRGPAGPPGFPGLPGRKGDAGEPGRKGWAGLPGLYGQKGEKGQPGRDGPSGARGEPGDWGDSGQNGMPGPRGERGDPGRPGAPGGFGEQGVSGPRGLAGPRGAPGPVGPPGVMGFYGLDGLNGIKGQRGVPGPLGKTNKCPVAFFASLQKAEKVPAIAANAPLALDKVITNIGDAFDAQTGKFVAPFKGVYAFYVSVGAQPGKTGAIIVQHKGKPVGTVYADSTKKWSSARHSYMMSLFAGEEVNFLVSKTAPNLHGELYTSVSGNCLWSDE